MGGARIEQATSARQGDRDGEQGLAVIRRPRPDGNTITFIGNFRIEY